MPRVISSPTSIPFEVWDGDFDTGIQVEKTADEDIIQFNVGDSEGTAYTGILKIGGDTTGFIWNDSSAAIPFRFESAGDEYLIYNNGTSDSLTIGTSTAELTINSLSVRPKLLVKDGSGDSNISFLVQSDSNVNTQGAFCVFARSRSSLSAIQNGDRIGVFRFDGHDGTQFITTGLIQGVVNGTISTGIVPTNLEFHNMDSSGAVRRNMLILPNGNVGINDNFPTYKLSVDGDMVINESKNDKDVLIWGTSAVAIWHDAGSKRLRFGHNFNGDVLELWASKTEFNRINADVDFQVRTLGNNNTIFADGGLNRVGIGTASMASVFEVAGSLGLKVDTLTSATLTLHSGHNIINVSYTSTGAVTITLPSATSSWNSTSGVGRTYIIKDGGANASVNNITINRSGTDTIITDVTGGTSVVINGDGDAVRLTAVSATTWILH